MSEQAVRHLVTADTLAAETKREPWVTRVCPAGRAAIDKALSVTPRLGATELRVALAVVKLTVLWSKLSDEVYLQQVADLANVGAESPEKPDDPESVERWSESRRKQTSRALRRTAQLGIIHYRPGKGKGNPSTIGIPALDDEDVSFKRELTSPLLNDTNAQKGAGESPKGGCCAPLPERDPERSSSSAASAPPEGAEEEEPDSVGEACRLVAERRLAVRTGKPITNRERWLTAVAARARSELDGLDVRGLNPEAIADRIQPRPGSPHAAFDPRGSPMWTELADGTVVAAGDRGG